MLRRVIWLLVGVAALAVLALMILVPTGPKDMAPWFGGWLPSLFGGP